MKTMLFYELKKILTMPKAAVTGAAILIFCCVTVFVNCGYYIGRDHAAEVMEYSAAAGELTEEKAVLYRQKAQEEEEKMRENPDNWIDGHFFPKDSGQYHVYYKVVALADIADQEKNMIAELETTLSDPEMTENEKILIRKNIEMLNEKGPIYGGYNKFYDLYEVFKKNLAPLLLGFLIIFLTAPIFSTEYSMRMDGLILSSKHGKRKVILAKLLAACITVTTVFILTIGCYALLSGAILGFEGGNTSIRALHLLGWPYDFTALQYWMISLGIAYLACIGVTTLMLFLSSVSRSSTVAAAIGLAAFYVPLFIGFVNDSNSKQTVFLNLAYSRIIQVTPLFERFTGYVIFDHVIMLKEIALTFSILLTAIFGVLAFYFFKRRQVKN